ncbi:hypothetical protein Dimus_000205 [Dionaea muscipula]
MHFYVNGTQLSIELPALFLCLPIPLRSPLLPPAPMEDALGNLNLYADGATASETNFASRNTTAGEPTVAKPLEGSDNDDGDSYFELELTLRNYNAKAVKNPSRNGTSTENDTDSELNNSKRASTTSSCSSEETSFYGEINRVESPDIRLSSEKSPISILRSPTIRALMFGGRYNRSNSKKSETEADGVVGFSPKRSHGKRRFFTFRFRIDEVTMIRRSNSTSSSRSTRSSSSTVHRRLSSDDSASSKHGGGIGKYLNLLRPLHNYLNVSRWRGGEREKETEDFGPSTASIQSCGSKAWMCSPVNAARQGEDRRSSVRFRVPDGRSFGKSRSASATVGLARPPANFPTSMKDDSMAQQNDGIEGAILHCKQSLSACPGRQFSSPALSVTFLICNILIF